MNLIRRADLTDLPWKNRGGITREITAAYDGNTVLWRLSLADVTADGAFSRFEGLARILTVVAGNGMALNAPHKTLRANLNEPVSFEGALKIRSVLNGGPVQAFNLIYDPAKCIANVKPIEGPYHVKLQSDLQTTKAVFCSRGKVEIDADIQLEQGDTAVIRAQAVTCELGHNASALVVSLTC